MMVAQPVLGNGEARRAELPNSTRVISTLTTMKGIFILDKKVVTCILFLSRSSDQ